MKTLIKYELRQSRKALIIWLGILAMLVAFCYFEFLSLQDSLDEMARMLEEFPKLLKILFGVKSDLSTAIGWYSCLYFWCGLLVFAYGAVLGVSCVAKEKKQGTSEYLFTKPVGRGDIVLAKAAASVLHLAVFSVVCGLLNNFLLVRPMGGLERPGAVLSTTVGLFLTELLFFSLGLFLAAAIPSYKKAVRANTALMLGAYGLSFAAQYTGLRPLDFLTPLRYFDVYEVAVHGIQVPFLLLTVCITAFCVLGAKRRWELREL